MAKKWREIGKFIGWIASTLGGLASSLIWLGVKPKDLAMTQTITIPRALWLILAIALFAFGIGSSIWSGIIQRREINRLNSNPQSSGLRIISAEWGIVGEKVIDVTPDVVERQRGDSFSERVMLGLFHGRDPVKRKTKFLSVRYSLDGREATIIRPEYSWLILPENTFLENQLNLLQKELHRASSLLSPLQTETLNLAHGLSALLRSYPVPQKVDFGFNKKEQRFDSTTDIHAWGDAKWAMEAKLRAKYALDFQSKATTLYHRLVTEVGINDHNLEFLVKGDGKTEDVVSLVDALRKVVFTLEDLKN